MVGRTVSAVHAPDDWFIKGGADAAALTLVLEGQAVVGVRRTGKLLMMEFGHPDGVVCAVLGLRFGMTGRLVVDDHAVIEKLEYSSARVVPEWRRFELGISLTGGRWSSSTLGAWVGSSWILTTPASAPTPSG